METVLVTGAFGLVGSATVRQLAVEGHHVVATDLDTPANRKAAAGLPPAVGVRYADLTDPAGVDNLVGAVAPAAIIHLAAVIPPATYLHRNLARKVNIDAVRHLLAAAARQPSPPRFVQASSIAVYGSRNPHTAPGVLTADTPTGPADVYGDHKLQAERLVRSAELDWVILRLGGVLTVEPAKHMSLDSLYLESLLPTDGRLQTVDVRDVASAFAAAGTADAEKVVGHTLLIGGDDTHRQVQGDIAPAIAAAMGLAGGMPPGLKGDPGSDEAWFATDWMDTATAQNLLGHQHHSWPEMLVEIADRAGMTRHLLRLAAPVARRIFQRRAAYHGSGRRYADPWSAIGNRWGDPRPDRKPG